MMQYELRLAGQGLMLKIGQKCFTSNCKTSMNMHFKWTSSQSESSNPLGNSAIKIL